MCASFLFIILLQERFLEKAKLSPDYFIAECEDMLVILSTNLFSLFGQIFYKVNYNKSKSDYLGRNTVNALWKTITLHYLYKDNELFWADHVLSWVTSIIFCLSVISFIVNRRLLLLLMIYLWGCMINTSSVSGDLYYCDIIPTYPVVCVILFELYCSKLLWNTVL